MKKAIVTVMFFCFPVLGHTADININLGNVRIESPGLTVTFGSQDRRGYYWDGREYRDPDYWKRHNGHKGEKVYTGRGDKGAPHQDGGHCPPGQAKKGRC